MKKYYIKTSNGSNFNITTDGIIGEVDNYLKQELILGVNGTISDTDISNGFYKYEGGYLSTKDVVTIQGLNSNALIVDFGVISGSTMTVDFNQIKTGDIIQGFNIDSTAVIPSTPLLTSSTFKISTGSGGMINVVVEASGATMITIKAGTSTELVYSAGAWDDTAITDAQTAWATLSASIPQVYLAQKCISDVLSKAMTFNIIRPNGGVIK